MRDPAPPCMLRAKLMRLCASTFGTLPPLQMAGTDHNDGLLWVMSVYAAPSTSTGSKAASGELDTCHSHMCRRWQRRSSGMGGSEGQQGGQQLHRLRSCKQLCIAVAPLRVQVRPHCACATPDHLTDNDASVASAPCLPPLRPRHTHTHS